MSTIIKRIGVIGAGQMGSGIAHTVAVAGFNVVLNDVAEDRVQGALATINGNLARLVQREQLTETARTQALGRIKASTDYVDLADCDLVIEAATENEATKRKIFSTLCPLLKPETLVASNTSSISITRLASVTDRPERFIGIHFMNPVPRMQLVELIRGIQTEPAPPSPRPRPLSSSSARHRPCPRIFRPSSSTASCCR